MIFVLVLVRALLFSIVCLTGVFLVNVIQFPAALLLWPWRRTYRNWMKFSQKVFGCILIATTFLFAPLQIVVTGAHQDLSNKTFAPIIGNHQIYTDWWYIWLFSCFRNAHGEIKILLIEALSRIPLMGWGMKSFEFIFLARRWKIDRPRIVSALDKARRDESAMWLLLFPEGTVLCKETMEKSVEYSKKSDILFSSNHTLLPKCTGLFHSIRSLQTRSEYLYDFTIGYSDHTKDEYAYDKFSPYTIFCEGKGPKQVHIHVDRFKISTLPGIAHLPYDADEETTPAFESWLYRRFEQKNQLMIYFYEHGHFPPSHAGPKEVLDISPKRMGWASLTLTLSLTLLILTSIYYIYIT